MDVFSMELGIRLSFVKISGFQGGFEPPKPPLVRHCQVGGRNIKPGKATEFVWVRGCRTFTYVRKNKYINKKWLNIFCNW
jgi:hypothetical protein